MNELSIIRNLITISKTPLLRPPTENSPWTLLPPFGSPLEKNVRICTCLLLQFLCIPALHSSSCSQLLCNTVNSQKKMPESCTYYIFLLLKLVTGFQSSDSNSQV